MGKAVDTESQLKVLGGAEVATGGTGRVATVCKNVASVWRVPRSIAAEARTKPLL
ncbi:MAG: hypothetical protein AB7O38_17570 [Pirellulaceae bacterium]